MTGLARWLALPGIAGLFFGVLRAQPTLALLSFSVLLWLLAEWLLFTWRVWVELPHLQFQRTVNGRTEPNGLVWAGRTIQVSVRVSSTRGTIAPPLIIRDVVPENMDVIKAEHEVRVTKEFNAFTFSYSAKVRGAGRMRLPGFRIVMQDAQGFFQYERFIPHLQNFRVLPAYAEVGDTQPLVKRINSLPQHGIHRLQRSGMGSELLELREYVDGDPPKSIAWKASARRDKLMTRQYESDVPVRLQLFLDGSVGTRVGGFGLRLLDQMTYVGASVARTAISAGDPVGAVLFDERGDRRVSSQSGERGFHRLLEAMSDFCVNPAPIPDRLSPTLMTFALSVASEQFPELLDSKVNQIPFTLFPILPWSARRQRSRFLLAGVLAELYRMSPAKHVQLMHDDGLMATFTQHFLSQTGLSWMNPVVAIRGRGFHDGIARMEMLSQALTTSVMLARDNEVFVVLADLIECASSISHLLPAVKMVLARHHRIAFVCPTPTFKRPTPASTELTSTAAEDLLFAAEQTRTRDLSTRLQRDLRRLGATVALAGEANAIQLVLSEMQLARSGRSGMRGGAR
jgi:uncharacterized protein (DUF58 family)